MSDYPESEFEQERTFARRWRYHDRVQRLYHDWLAERLQQYEEMHGIWPRMVDSSGSSKATSPASPGQSASPELTWDPQQHPSQGDLQVTGLNQ